MHALSRHVAWHTELFLTPAEFERFWATHAEVALRKIQLRYIRRDGMPHSPFRDEDCVSADLFLFRFDKAAFDGYLAKNLPNVRMQPRQTQQLGHECNRYPRRSRRWSRCCVSRSRTCSGST